LITYPAGLIPPHGAYSIVKGDQPMMGYRSPDDAICFHLMGGMAPFPAVHDNGIVVNALKGLIPPWQTQDQQGAVQDGVTFNGAVYDPIVVDIGVTAFGRTPALARKVIRHWIEAWDVKRQGELFTITEAGYWFAPVRWFKTPTDQILGAQRRKQGFLWTARADDGFYRSFDSVCQFPPPGSTLSGGAGSGFNTVTNPGDQPGWVNHVAYGPFTEIQIANGPGSTSMIKFGPLLANQIALLRTEPRRRGVYDLTPADASVPQQQLTAWQTFLKQLVSFALNNNIPPLLRQFESLFGILPPQGEFYTLLQGRFSKSVPPKPIGGAPVESNIAVKITGGNAQTKLVTYLTPLRRWPQ
jgi:hypothetical protein